MNTDDVRAFIQSQIPRPTGHQASEFVLDGKSITAEIIKSIAHGARVGVAPSAMERVAKAHQILVKAAAAGRKIYGLTVGVGWNKDRPMVNAEGQLTPEVIVASQAFNLKLIRAHCGGFGPDLDAETARFVQQYFAPLPRKKRRVAQLLDLGRDSAIRSASGEGPRRSIGVRCILMASLRIDFPPQHC